MEEPFVKFSAMAAVGMILGVVFFGGLWMTVRQMTFSRRPGLLFVASVAVRTFIVLAGIWYFAAGDAASMAACLAGFVGLRLLATHGGGILSDKLAAFFSRKETS